MGLNSLPVAFGVDGAKYICAGAVTLTQLGVAAYLYGIGEPYYALALLALILPQIYFQATLLLPDPIDQDPGCHGVIGSDDSASQSQSSFAVLEDSGGSAAQGR